MKRLHHIPFTFALIAIIYLAVDITNAQDDTSSLSPDIIEKSYFAAFLSHAMYRADDLWKKGSKDFCDGMEKALLHQEQSSCNVVKDPTAYDVKKFKLFADTKGLTRPQGDDFVALYRWKNTCFAAWRGTDVGDSPLDMIQNAPTITGFEEMTGPRGSCSVRRGWKYAYGLDYASGGDGPVTRNMLGDIRTCIGSCRHRTDDIAVDDNEGCELVLTGHSQGGAAAAVAAIALADEHPYLITFGQPGVYREGQCEVVDPGRTYRYTNQVIESHVNTMSGYLWENALWYDRTPRLFMDDSFGRLIVLSDDEDEWVMYPNGQRDVSATGWAPKSTFTAHASEVYRSRIEKIYEDHKSPRVGLKIIPDGRPCYFNDECKGICRWISTTAKWWHLPKKGHYECMPS